MITAPVMFWDAAFCFMRPRSFHGGDLHWIWSPYAIYQNVDLVYGVEAFARNDGLPNANAFMNVFETVLSLWYLYLAHLQHSPSAPLVGFTAAALTLSKTAHYLLQEFYCDYCTTGHNDLPTLTKFYLIPNTFWVVFPTLIVYRLSKDIVASLDNAGPAQFPKRKAE